MNKEIISPYIWAGLPEKLKYKKINFDDLDKQPIYNMIESICNILEVPHLRIYNRDKAAYLVDAKRISVHFIHKYTKLTLNQIASIIQLKDHSSIIHLLETCIQFYENDKIFRDKFNLVQSQLTSEFIMNKFELRLNNKLMYNDNGIIIRD